ncbi:hypothetical protein ACM66B_006639 [Microbotryomycetes sp. NB124-2]
MQRLRSPGSAAEHVAAIGSSSAHPAPQAQANARPAPAPPPSTHRSPDNEAATHYDSAAGKGPGVIQVAGEATFHGRGAGALFLIDGEEDLPSSPLVYPYPFMSLSTDPFANLGEILPAQWLADAYIETYFKDVDWMYCPCLRTTLEADLTLLYADPSSLQTRARSLHPHRLALLLSVFAIAVVFQRPIGPGHEENVGSSMQNKYFNAASTLLAAAPHHFMSRPTVASVQTLHVMVSFLFCSGDREGAKGAWTLLGAAMRSAQSLGLHKNCDSWNLPSEETAERARTWWELFTYDLLQSLNFGRPYSIPVQFVQCPAPAALNPLASRGSSLFHSIKYDLALLFGRVADLLASAELPDYSEVLLLDKALRSHEARAPDWLRLTDFSGVPRADDTTSSVAQRHMLCLLLHKALLALHRPWFAKAVMHDSDAEPMTSPWAASFNACCISARKHVHLMKSILLSAPQIGYRWWFFLFHTFTSAVIQSSVLLRAPTCMLADDIRDDFLQAFSVFAEVAPSSALGRRGYEILLKLRSSIFPAADDVNKTAADAAGSVFNPLPDLDGNSKTEAFTFTKNQDSSSLFPDASFTPQSLSTAATSTGAPFPGWGLAHDPAGVLLSDSGDPLAWDPLSWANGDSIDQTLMFWNMASAGGTFDFTTSGNEDNGMQGGSIF